MSRKKLKTDGQAVGFFPAEYERLTRETDDPALKLSLKSRARMFRRWPTIVYIMEQTASRGLCCPTCDHVHAPKYMLISVEWRSEINWGLVHPTAMNAIKVGMPLAFSETLESMIAYIVNPITSYKKLGAELYALDSEDVQTEFPYTEFETQTYRFVPGHLVCIKPPEPLDGQSADAHGWLKIGVTIHD